MVMSLDMNWNEEKNIVGSVGKIVPYLKKENETDSLCCYLS